MNETPKKRARLQFHLSTAVVLMFVASGMLWVNLCAGRKSTIVVDYDLVVGFEPVRRPHIEFGWPCVCNRPDFTYISVSSTTSRALQLQIPALQWQPLLMDVAVAAAVLAVVAVFCEWRIRE
jgi:hypothetical protein